MKLTVGVVRTFCVVVLSLALGSASVFARPIVIPGNVDPEKIVVVGKSTSYSIIGVGSTQALKEYLGEHHYEPQGTLGKTTITLGVSVNDDFVGCGCPKAFNEFMVTYAIASDRDAGTQVVPDFSVTNHPQRQHSMATKFGTILELGEVGLDGDRGFFVRDAEGQLLIQAKSRFSMPPALLPQFGDYSFHSLGGIFEEVERPQTFFKIVGNAFVGFKPFLPLLDRIQVNPSSRLGRMLRNVGFLPMAWAAADLKDGRAWIPPQ